MLHKSSRSSSRSSFLADSSSSSFSSTRSRVSSRPVAANAAAAAATASMRERMTKDPSNAHRHWRNFSLPHMRERNQCGLLILLTILLEIGIIPTRRLGFFCNDEKISLKFTGDTVSTIILLVFAIFIPFIMMCLVEYVCHSLDSYDKIAGTCGPRLKQIWIWYGQYSMGLVSVILLTDIMKILIGEPRPHFLDTCRPREASNCTDNKYIERYTCTNTVDPFWKVADSSKSFPSGHASISMYMTIFLLCYVQSRVTKKTFLIKPWLQCILSIWAIVCSLTRITDNRHHWWDVLVGDGIGILMGVLVVVVRCRCFRAGTEKYMVMRVPKDSSTTSEQKNPQKLFNNSGEIDMPERRELRDVTVS